MSSQFADFAKLKELKKTLEKESEASSAATGVQKSRSKTIVHRSIHEEHARNEGYVKGQRVRMMDTNDEATLTGFRKDCYELTFDDGLVITAVKSEFILINKAEDAAMYRSMPSAPKKNVETAQSSGSKGFSSGEPLTIDLHLERIPGNESIPEWAALDFQLDYFRRVMRDNSRYKGKRIVFIHGFGDNRLRDSLRRELDEVFALSATYQPGTSDNFGPGTLIVTIK